MQAANRSNARAKVRDAADIPEVAEPLALLRIFCNKNDLICYLFQGIDEPLDEGPALVHEEIFLLAVGASGLSPYEDDGGSLDRIHLLFTFSTVQKFVGIYNS
jgi:hypothetical protein